MVLVALACVATLWTARTGATAAVRWLSTCSTPGPADLLVVVGGGAEERLVTGADLFRHGYAGMILVTEPSGLARIQTMLEEAPGLAPGKLAGCPGRVASTVDDALCIRQLTEEKGFRSILVVTSPYHCRRLGLILRRTMGDLDVAITVIGSTSLYWPLETWWRHTAGWEIPAEMAKLAWAWATVPKRHKVAT